MTARYFFKTLVLIFGLAYGSVGCVAVSELDSQLTDLELDKTFDFDKDKGSPTPSTDSVSTQASAQYSSVSGSVE